MERMLVEYLANAFWQLPLLAGGAWLLLRMTGVSAAAQHRVWLGVLGLALVLPLHGAGAVALLPARVRTLGGATQAGAQVERSGWGGSSLTTISASGFDSVGAADGLVPVRRSAGIGAIVSKLAAAARVRRVSLAAGTARWIAGLYLGVALLGLIRIVLAWEAARRLVAGSREVAAGGRLGMAVAECSRRMGVRVPQVRGSSEIKGPVVVGAAQPVLLWPESFAHWDDDEVVAALCHEMAHIRRRDYAMNLLCEAAAVPLKWHPVTYGVARRIRSTREMACDAMAAAAMESEAVYAKCLLSLAQSMVRGLAGSAGRSLSGSAAAGLFNGNALEERMMRLMRGESIMSTRAKALRGVAGAAAMMLAIELTAGFHVVPAEAQTQPAAAQSGAVGQKVQAGVPDGMQGRVRDGVQDAAVSSDVKVKPVAPVVKVRPLVQLATVSPVVNVTPMVKVSPVVKVAPVVKVRPFGDLAVVTPVIHVMPELEVLPKVQVTPDSPGKPKGSASGGNGSGHRMYAIVDGQERELTPEEQRRVDKQLAAAQKQIEAALARLNSPEFRKQIEDAQRQTAKIDSGEFQKQMADAQKQVAEATARVNSPEFQKQIEEMTRKLESGEFQKQMADAQKELAAQMARLNSPEFKAQMEKAQRDAEEATRKIDSAEFQKQMAEAQKQLADAMARMKAEQEQQETIRK